NPEREEIMGQFVGCIDGMAMACATLGFPVVSGNVSLYNETNGAAIPPTPAIGGVGLIPDIDKRAGFGGMKDGDILLVVGETQGVMGASVYLKVIEDREDGDAPHVDLDAEKANGDFVRGQIRAGRLTACHDISDGGLACAAADMALASDCGIKLAHEGANPPMHGFLFGEDQSRYLIAARKEDAIAILQDAKADEIPVQVVGLAGGTAISVNGAHPLKLDRLRAAWEGWMPGLMDQLVEAAE
ncbi:MAG: phosphoribosylformylglycinamidine synthase II, partial [Maricaulis sp.]|nr:phosphoribosylformylglycinamidine synthase II [Maricaulis sp.]